MARLCVRIADNAHPTDPKLTPLRTQPGNVICVVDDKHEFSKAELTNGQYMIVDVPGVPESDLAYLCEPAFDKSGVMIAKRAQSLDIATLQSDPSYKTDQPLIADETSITAVTIANPIVAVTDLAVVG